MTIRRIPRKTIVAALGALLLTAAVYLYFHEPGRPGSLLPPCLFHEWTGLYCAGCGNTRAAYLLLHGDFAGSLRQNILLLPLAGTLLLFLLRPKWLPRAKPAVWLLLGVLIAFTVLRNLPPGRFLAPPPVNPSQPKEAA